jgi:hypothetical protein
MSVRNTFCQIYFRFVIKTYEPPDYTSTYIFSKTEFFKLTFEISKYGNISSSIQEIPTIYGTGRFITVFTTAYHVFLPSATATLCPRPHIRALEEPF